jgi:hypothetical protein
MEIHSKFPDEDSLTDEDMMDLEVGNDTPFG